MTRIDLVRGPVHALAQVDYGRIATDALVQIDRLAWALLPLLLVGIAGYAIRHWIPLIKNKRLQQLALMGCRWAQQTIPGPGSVVGQQRYTEVASWLAGKIPGASASDIEKAIESGVVVVKAEAGQAAAALAVTASASGPAPDSTPGAPPVTTAAPIALPADLSGVLAASAMQAQDAAAALMSDAPALIADIETKLGLLRAASAASAPLVPLSASQSPLDVGGRGPDAGASQTGAVAGSALSRGSSAPTPAPTEIVVGEAVRITPAPVAGGVAPSAPASATASSTG